MSDLAVVYAGEHRDVELKGAVGSQNPIAHNHQQNDPQDRLLLPREPEPQV